MTIDPSRTTEGRWAPATTLARLVVVIVTVVIATTQARGQSTNPVAPGSLGQPRVPTKTAVDNAIENARFRLGPLRFGPWMELEDLSYTDNVFGTEINPQSDVTARVSAGLYGHVPLGKKVVLGLVALPSYVWWKDISALRDWDYIASAGLFGYFNRLTLEAKATDSQRQTVQDPSFGPPANQMERSFWTSAEVKVLGRLSVFGSGLWKQLRYEAVVDDDSASNTFSYLDRDEDYLNLGLRYRWSPEIAIGLGVQTYAATFQEEARDYSNSGDGGLLDVALSLGSIKLTATYANMTLRAEESSEFADFSGLLGRSELRWIAGGGWEAALYGGRSLSYGSATRIAADTRYGFNLSFPAGWRLRLGAYVESGYITYVGFAGGFPESEEDVDAVGANANVKVGEWMLRFGYSRTRYTRQAPESRREIGRISMALSVPGTFAPWW